MENFRRPFIVHPELQQDKVPLVISLSSGDGSRFDVMAVKINGTLHVAIENHGSYRFHGYAHPSYVRAKLIDNEKDAKNMSDWINTQLGVEYD